MLRKPYYQPVETLHTNHPIRFVKKFFYHPILNVIFGIVGVIGLIVTFQEIRNPDLIYYISPTRTPIVQKGNFDNVSINFQGVQITNNLSGATIQIWNQGKAPIHRADILKAITLKTQNGEKIYQVTAKSTREVVGFNYTNNNQSGVLNLDWNILEQGDGVLLQIIYGGNVDVPLIFDGVIEEQKKGISQFKNDNSKVSETYAIGFAIGLIATVIISICCDYLAEIVVKRYPKKVKRIKIVVVTIIIIALFSLVLVYFGTPSKPPFGL